MATVLVTGGSGFIGGTWFPRCRRAAISSAFSTWRRRTKSGTGIEFVQGSILDRAKLLRALDGIDRVFHLAGIAHLWAPRRADFDRANREGTEMVLSAAEEAKVARFVHCSTEAILMPPRGSDEPVDEAVSLTVADMAGPYTRSKYLAEQAALSAARRGGSVVIVNPTLPIGPGDLRLTPPTAMLERCLRTRMPVSLDFVLNLADVRDIAEGMILAAERGRIGERYILGGSNMSMRELAAALEEPDRKETSRDVDSPVARSGGGSCG